jgi:hypothetical protein
MFKRASYVSIDSMIFDDDISPERVNKISEEIADVLTKNGLAIEKEDDPVYSMVGIKRVPCHPKQIKVFKKLLRNTEIIIFPKDAP